MVGGAAVEEMTGDDARTEVAMVVGAGSAVGDGGRGVEVVTEG